MKPFALLFTAAVCAGVCGAENLVRNGDFARGGADWRSPQYTGGRKFHTFVRGQLAVSGNTAAEYNSFASLVQPLPKLDPAKEYLLRAEVAVNIPDRAKKHFRLAVRHASADGKSLLYSDLNPDLTTTEKRTYTIRFRPHPAAAAFYVYVISINLADTDTATVDNISVTEAPAAAGEAGNLVQNGNFAASGLAPWVSYCGRAKNLPFAVVADPETADRVLAVNGDPQNRNSSFLTLIQPLPQLMSAKKYRLKARIRAGLADTAKKEVWLSVRESDMDNNTILYDGIKADLGNGDWKEYSLVFIPNVEADKFELYVRSTRLADGDTVLVDDISLTQVK